MKAPHPFPARMAPDLALASVSQAFEGPVLDPMCGSGVVLRAASLEGKAAIGFDVDPLAVLMSSVWTAPDDFDLLTAASDLVRKAQSEPELPLPWLDEDPESLAFIDFWFAAAQAFELRRLAAQLWELPNDPQSNALRLALSRTIITKSVGASLASDVSHSRPHRTRTSNDYDVFAGFVKAASHIEKSLASSGRAGGAVQVALGDARNLSEVPSGTVGMVVTSPPYLNAIDYLRGHRMALVWLGHSIASLRKIRSESIGAERALPSDQTKPAAERIADKARIDDFAPKLQGMLRRYVGDLSGTMSEVARVLKPGHQAVIVVGNSTIRDEYVDNANFCALAGEEHGLSLARRVERDLPANRRYLPIPKAASPEFLSKRMREEVVLTLQK